MIRKIKYYRLIMLALCIFVINSVSAQNIDSVITKLKGKWDWSYTMDGWGYYDTPALSGFTKSIIIYQEPILVGSDTISYLTFKNDSLIAEGITHIVYNMNGSYQILDNIIKDTMTIFNITGMYIIGIHNDTLLNFMDPGFDSYNHYYKKDTSYIYAYSNKYKIDPEILIFPNPVKDVFNIETSQNVNIEFFNMQGQIIKTLNLSITKTSIDISKFTSGVYTIKIKINNRIIVKKLIKL